MVQSKILVINSLKIYSISFKQKKFSFKNPLLNKYEQIFHIYIYIDIIIVWFNHTSLHYTLSTSCLPIKKMIFIDCTSTKTITWYFHTFLKNQNHLFTQNTLSEKYNILIQRYKSTLNFWYLLFARFLINRFLLI